MTPLERVSARVNRLGDVTKKGTPLPLLTIAGFSLTGTKRSVASVAICRGPPPASVMRALCEGIAAQQPA